MTHAANGTKPLNILLVEDDDGDAMAVARAFKAAKIAKISGKRYGRCPAVVARCLLKR